jgi:hypothetical protein
MKKRIVPFLILALSLLLASISDASYLIRLKNGGQLATPAYWTEGKWIFFYCVGGTAGIERKEIDRIEKLKTEGGEYIDKTPAIAGKKELPPLPPAAEKEKGPEKPPEAKEEKVDLNAYKDKKAQMTVELDALLEKQREAAGRGDIEAKEKIMGEIRNTSSQIYKLTDEVKEKNKGKLPGGWWEK